MQCIKHGIKYQYINDVCFVLSGTKRNDTMPCETRLVGYSFRNFDSQGKCQRKCVVSEKGTVENKEDAAFQRLESCTVGGEIDIN